MLYLILVICALSLGAEAQTCNCSIANLPQCLLPNTTVTGNTTVVSNTTDPLLCIVADLYNLVNGLTGGSANNVLAIVADVLLNVLQLLSNLGYPISGLTDTLIGLVNACIPENSGLGNDLQSLLDTLLGAVASILRLVGGVLRLVLSIVLG